MTERDILKVTGISPFTSDTNHALRRSFLYIQEENIQYIIIIV